MSVWMLSNTVRVVSGQSISGSAPLLQDWWEMHLSTSSPSRTVNKTITLAGKQIKSGVPYSRMDRRSLDSTLDWECRALHFVQQRLWWVACWAKVVLMFGLHRTHGLCSSSTSQSFPLLKRQNLDFQGQWNVLLIWNDLQIVFPTRRASCVWGDQGHCQGLYSQREHFVQSNIPRQRQPHRHCQAPRFNQSCSSCRLAAPSGTVSSMIAHLKHKQVPQSLIMPRQNSSANAKQPLGLGILALISAVIISCLLPFFLLSFSAFDLQPGKGVPDCAS